MKVKLPWPPDQRFVHLVEVMLLKAIHAWESTGTAAPAARPPIDTNGQIDHEWQQAWIADLNDALKADVVHLANLLKLPEFLLGEFNLNIENAEAISRACSALRLFLRSNGLKNFSDSTLENGEIDLDKISPSEATAFLTYCFLANLQTALINAVMYTEFGDRDGTD